ncbi:ABC transporter ATP-binding protein [Viridibacillus sp. YIM B01967]|uniref:ABC transporter ATP-binding protein n=1 Tax=Viridibacillus soli TaxID=2798301 RepID=A0ABS1HED7_9BACL|nr:ABC transporter ATP-binding protein [Viridibacillus soli]MBK3497358.1 ABC transporter ATP-binding protein [Viridibacillus soli]
MELKDISLSHDQKTMHLDHVSTTIKRGKVTTIIGPNGCGKSTLLSVMSRNNTPSTGTAQLAQKDLMNYKPKEFAKKLAIVYQQNEIPKELTVEKLVAYGRIPHNQMFKKDAKKDEAAIQWALESTKLIDKSTKSLEALSGGERQRVWIALALAQQTEILCLDEPTTYLDIYYQLELLELVKRLNEEHGLTIVMVLHDINQAIRYSDHIILMQSGKIIAEGAPEEVITEQLIKTVYGVKVLFKNDEPSAGLYIVPIGI